MNRRAFLKGSAVATGAYFVRVPKLAFAEQPAVPVENVLYELTSRPANYESVRSTYTMRITPLERFYIRNHFDMPVGDPAEWAKTWKLEVRGLVGKPLALTLADLEKRKQTTVEAVPAEQMKPMTKLTVKSQLGSISDGDVLAPGNREIVGVAFSGESRIKKVDITLDGGATWQPAKLDPHDSAYGFRLFTFAFDAKPGKLHIGSRATDATGAVQPAEPVWNPSGYLYNAIEVVSVEVKA